MVPQFDGALDASIIDKISVFCFYSMFLLENSEKHIYSEVFYTENAFAHSLGLNFNLDFSRKFPKLFFSFGSF